MAHSFDDIVYQLRYDPVVLIKYAPIDEIRSTLSIFNNINHSKFTIEYEEENRINYLDTLIIRKTKLGSLNRFLSETNK